ncbi:MAG TPA: hypothetical protein VEN79_15985 [Terriglobia bacterium]|nr:hypothetical protein [Terriglobia bacterium]
MRRLLQELAVPLAPQAAITQGKLPPLVGDDLGQGQGKPSPYKTCKLDPAHAG